MKMRKCPKCGVYTLKETCKICGIITVSPHPLRFSQDDKWGVWRRKAKLKLGQDK